jgi:ankyrin repeat protein
MVVVASLVLLVFSGCDPDQPDTPLAAAAARGQAQEVSALLAAGADPDQMDSHGWSALICGARAGSVAVVKSLLASGANPNLRDSYVNGWTPLMHALHKHQNEAAQILLDRGADVNARSKSCVTALIMAAGDGNLDMIQLLLERGADPYAEDSSGASALSMAVSGGAFSDIDRPLLGECQTELVEALLQKAPDLRLKNNFAGRFARKMARLKGCSDVLDLIR